MSKPRIIRYQLFNYKKAKAHGRKKYFAGEIIKRRSYPETHGEVQLSWFYHDISFSSTMEDAFKGCRFKLIGYSSPWWDTYEREVTPEQEHEIWMNCHKINGKKYDLWGLGSYGTKWKIIVPSRDRYWCTGATAFVTSLKDGSLWKGTHLVTPEEMGKILRAEDEAKNRKLVDNNE